MLLRIVKMEFRPEETERFLTIFHESAPLIRAFPGCHHLELLQDRLHSHILFTYSYWESDDALNAYRHSELFARTWEKTKALFGGKPEAWSVDRRWSSATASPDQV